MSNYKFHPIQQEILYPASMEKMDLIFSEVKEESFGQILSFEYPPLFTLGRSLKDKATLLPDGVPKFQTERGGLVTFHNPGQLVIYPILNLKNLNLGVKEFIFKMEESVLKSIADFSVEAFRKDACPGVFTEQGKLMSMGFRIKEGISTHGMAINVCNSLEDFQGLNLCSSKAASLDRISNYHPNIDTEEFYLVWQKNFLNEFTSKK
ncbi:MAG: lipoyl(octanoyl) transferase LipB [Bdellovibrionota bacterium]|nr:lipoyl(octanoyl) transferase LipB [Bdellovibrionota bacterium]